jgi:hypothetical protein
VDHDIDVDRATQDRHGPERRNYEEKMGITAFARLWVDTFVKGDQSTNPRVFNGLNVRARKFGRLFHNSTAAGGAALSLANFDQMLLQLSQKSGTSYVLIPFLSLPLWIQLARTMTLAGYVVQTFDEIGKTKISYAGLRFLYGYPKDDQAPVLQFNEVGQGGGAAVTASLYGLTLGEGMLRGIEVRPLTIAWFGDVVAISGRHDLVEKVMPDLKAADMRAALPEGTSATVLHAQIEAAQAQGLPNIERRALEKLDDDFRKDYEELHKQPLIHAGKAQWTPPVGPINPQNPPAVAGEMAQRAKNADAVRA